MNKSLDNQPVSTCSSAPVAAMVSRSLIDQLEYRLRQTLEVVRASSVFKALEDPQSPRGLVFGIMREVLAEVYTYQKRVDEAVFAAVGRFGLHIQEQSLVRAMIAVQIEEVGHGTIALEDYSILGGDADALRVRRPSPQSFALIAVVHRLATHEHPLAHLGYMYFFERFTTIMTEVVVPLLKAKGYPDERLQFMKLHAIEDIRHADMLSQVIRDCVERYPDANDAIVYGFDAFASVYPMPVWNAAYERAKSVESASDDR